jgi:hypothetical protein
MSSKYLAPAYIRWLFQAYSSFMVAGAILTGAIYFAIERPGVGLWFLAGVIIGISVAAFFVSNYLRERRHRALHYVHEIAHV